MRIAIYGASGMIGSRIAAEAVTRGHEVTGITRSGAMLPDGLQALTGDAANADFATMVAADHDVVVSAIGPTRTGEDHGEFRSSVATLVDTLGDRRLVVVGGAGTLEVNGQRLVDSPGFPEAYKPESLKGAEVLDDLRAVGDRAAWTYLSPAPEIAPGERSTTYRLGDDSPAGDHVTAEDFAAALLDEIETPTHTGRRFTVAS